MFLVSILENTNRVVANSQINWSNVKSGSYFRFKNNSALFSIISASPYTQFNEFEVINGNTIKVNDYVGINIMQGDEVKIIYNEYELVTIFGILNEGKNYKIKDKIKLDAQNSVVELQSGIACHSILEVAEVNATGGITKIALINKGRYTTQPENELLTIGGAGSGAKFQVMFKEIIVKEPVDRQIDFIENNIPCIIYLNAPIQNGVKKGKISIEKWELFLSSSFPSNLLNTEYEIIQDYTSNLKLPLLLPQSFSKEIYLNRSLNILDSEITQLKQEISQLKARLDVAPQ